MNTRKSLHEPQSFVGARVGESFAVKEDHLLPCRTCGQAFDMRDLEAVFHHEQPGHAPQSRAEARRLIQVSADLAASLSRTGRA